MYTHCRRGGKTESYGKHYLAKQMLKVWISAGQLVATTTPIIPAAAIRYLIILERKIILAQILQSDYIILGVVTTLILRLSVVCISLIIPRVAIFAPARQDFCLLLSVLCFWYSRILDNLPPLPGKYSAYIGFTKKLPANRSDSKLARGCSELWKKISSLALCWL